MSLGDILCRRVTFAPRGPPALAATDPRHGRLAADAPKVCHTIAARRVCESAHHRAAIHRRRSHGDRDADGPSARCSGRSCTLDCRRRGQDLFSLLLFFTFGLATTTHSQQWAPLTITRLGGRSTVLPQHQRGRGRGARRAHRTDRGACGRVGVVHVTHVGLSLTIR